MLNIKTVCARVISVGLDKLCPVLKQWLGPIIQCLLSAVSCQLTPARQLFVSPPQNISLFSVFTAILKYFVPILPQSVKRSLGKVKSEGSKNANGKKLTSAGSARCPWWRSLTKWWKLICVLWVSAVTGHRHSASHITAGASNVELGISGQHSCCKGYH